MYQTLYRKYRSNTLTDLVGQEHVVKTLKNAMSLDRLSHAYIFSGPRGTGKTSTARILAKMVNATTEDINSCNICQKIATGNCVDVIEIDAASHTGVDHMRQLTDQVQFLPVEAAYKVFIIDEVHMLSTGAFNALLKTLEEPPSNIVFILATTELHKIPATIQSRAQTLHFKPMSPDVLESHIHHICEQEQVSIDSAAMAKLIQHAKGGMRDALSLLDQLISICTDSAITAQDINTLLGSLQDDQLISFIKLCMEGATDDALTQLRSFLDEGVSVFQLYDDLLMVLKRVLFESEALPFELDLTKVSVFMSWICEQLVYLKSVAYPEVVCQVQLFTLLSNSSNGTFGHSSMPAQQSVAQQSQPPLPSQPLFLVNNNYCHP